MILFNALALPSGSGKTQLAFAFQSVYPIYLTFGRDDKNSQEIYRSFNTVSMAFRKAVTADLLFPEVKKSYTIPNMMANMFHTPLITLGLIDHIIQKKSAKEATMISSVASSSSHDSSNNNTVWMKQLAGMTFDDRIPQQSITIAEFMNKYKVYHPDHHLLQSFLLFVDEYPSAHQDNFDEDDISGSNWFERMDDLRKGLYLRNLACCIHLNVTVAGRNISSLTDLTEKKAKTAENKPWCQVYTTLPTLIDKDAIKQTMYYMEKQSGILPSTALGQFLHASLTNSSPGLAYEMMKVMKVMKEVASSSSDNNSAFFQRLLESLSKRIGDKKKTTKALVGRIANYYLGVESTFQRPHVMIIHPQRKMYLIVLI